MKRNRAADSKIASRETTAEVSSHSETMTRVNTGPTWDLNQVKWSVDLTKINFLIFYVTFQMASGDQLTVIPMRLRTATATMVATIMVGATMPMAIPTPVVVIMLMVVTTTDAATNTDMVIFAF